MKTYNMRDVHALICCPLFLIHTRLQMHKMPPTLCEQTAAILQNVPRALSLRDGTVRSKTITKARAKRSCARRTGYATDTQTLSPSSAVRAVGGPGALFTSHFGEDY